MDPVTIVQIVEGSLSLALQCGHATKTLNDIAAKYRYAELAIISMAQGLDTIQLAWNQIGEWSQSYVPKTVGEGEFLERLQRSLQNGSTVMNALERNLKPYQTEYLSFMPRSKAVWNEATLRGHQERISHPAVAMTCLLQAIQLKSSLARTRLIDEAEPMLRRSDESAYSIVPSRMSSRTSGSRYRKSLGGTSTASAELVYQRLSFENDLFTAPAYKRNYRNQLINQLFGSRRPLPLKSTSLSATLTKLAVPNTNGEVLASNTHESLQVHVQKEFVNEQTRQNISTPQPSGTDGWLPLQYAVDRGDLKMVELLLEAGANVSSTGSGTKPIHIASHRGNLEITSMLLDASAVINSTEKFRFELVHLASMVNRFTQVTLLVSAGANVEALNPLAPSSQTSPLQLACLTGQLANVCALHDLGALTDTGRHLLDAPLGIAIRQRHVDIARALLERGADPNYASRSKAKSLFATQSPRLGGPGMTPLSLLVTHFGDTQKKTALDHAMLDLLLEHGADVRSEDDEGNQVLHYLCNSQSLANLDINNADNKRLILTLLDQGIESNATNYNSEYPLYLATLNYNKQVVSRLLLNGPGCLSSAELFRFHKVVEGKEKGRPDMRDEIREVVKLIDIKREKGRLEKVPRRA